MATGPTEPLTSHEPLWESADPQSPPAEQAPAVGELHPAQMSFAARPGRLRVRHLMYLVAVVAVFLWAGILVAGSIVLGLLMVLGGVVMLFAAVMGICIIVGRRRSTHQDSLLSVLAIAAERDMPLAPAVVAFADQYRGRSHARVMDLAAELNWGNMLPEALERARTLVSRDAVLLAWVGQAAGMLPKALRMASASRSSFLPIWTAIATRLSYIIVLLLSIEFITGFVLYFIIPKFEAIFKDFGTPLPMLTIAVIDASHFIVRYAFPLFLLLPIEFILLVALPLSFLTWGNYNVPIFDRLLGRRHTALVLRSLALMVEGGKPVSLGLSTLANHYPIERIRRRLIRVDSDVRQGVDWLQALWRHGLIRATDGDVLAAAAAVGNLAWALSELAVTAERRMANRLQAVVQTVFPVVVILLGTVIFILCLAHFMPLVQLIGRLTDL